MKNRPDSFEKKLQKNQLEQLERWLFDDAPPLTYEQARERCWQDFSLRVSRSALERFHKRTSKRRFEDSIIEKSNACNAMFDKIEKNPADFYKVVLNLVGQIAFDNATDERRDPEVLYNFVKLMIAAKKEETRDQMLALDRKRFQRETCELFLKWFEDGKAKAILASSASTATKTEQLGELIFGELWKS